MVRPTFGRRLRVKSGHADDDVGTHDIQPGKPDRNADIERFNRSDRTEVPNARLFESIAELGALTDAGSAMPSSAEQVSYRLDGEAYAEAHGAPSSLATRSRKAVSCLSIFFSRASAFLSRASARPCLDSSR